MSGTFWDRTIGAVATTGFALDSQLTQNYDALIFFDQTTPSVLLRFPFAITTSSLPNGAVGVPYFQNLVSDYSPGPAWTVSSGALPAGLSLTSSGVLMGTPTTSGVYEFTISAAFAPQVVTSNLQMTVQDVHSGN